MKKEDTDDKKKALFSCKDGIAGAGNCDAATRTKVDAAAKKTIYNSPYVTFSPDGKAWTTCAGDRDYTWYDADTLVSTGITSSLRALNTGEHYYKVSRYGEIPIGYWQVSHRPAQCIHNGYPKDNHLYHGIQYGRHKCFRNYNSGWMAYCADCGEVIAYANMYMSRDAAKSIQYMDLGSKQNPMEYYFFVLFATTWNREFRSASINVKRSPGISIELLITQMSVYTKMCGDTWITVITCITIQQHMKGKQ